MFEFRKKSNVDISAPQDFQQVGGNGFEPISTDELIETLVIIPALVSTTNGNIDQVNLPPTKFKETLVMEELVVMEEQVVMKEQVVMEEQVIMDDVLDLYVNNKEEQKTLSQAAEGKPLPPLPSKKDQTPEKALPTSPNEEKKKAPQVPAKKKAPVPIPRHKSTEVLVEKKASPVIPKKVPSIPPKKWTKRLSQKPNLIQIG